MHTCANKHLDPKIVWKQIDICLKSPNRTRTTTTEAVDVRADIRTCHVGKLPGMYWGRLHQQGPWVIPTHPPYPTRAVIVKTTTSALLFLPTINAPGMELTHPPDHC